MKITIGQLKQVIREATENPYRVVALQARENPSLRGNSVGLQKLKAWMEEYGMPYILAAFHFGLQSDQGLVRLLGGKSDVTATVIKGCAEKNICEPNDWLTPVSGVSVTSQPKKPKRQTSSAPSLTLSKDQRDFWKKKIGVPVSFKTVVDGTYSKSYLPFKLISKAETDAMEKLGYATQLGKHFRDPYSDKPRSLAKKIFQVTMNDNGDIVLSSSNGSLVWNNTSNSWE